MIINELMIFSLICYKKFQSEEESCDDFEIRFCCDINLKQSNFSMVNSVNYSEKEFEMDEFVIRFFFIFYPPF